MSESRLVEIFEELAVAGCHNWNWVTPGPWLAHIDAAVSQLGARGIRLPMVYNTSGYERVDVAKRYRHLMDVVLTDLRYATASVAQEGSRAADYPEQARAFVRWAWETVGPLEVDAEGIAKRGVVVRLLVLPGREQEVIENLKWMKETIGTAVHVSVMSQYTPVHEAQHRAGWDRPITEAAYQRVVDAVDELGFENGWVQEFGACAPDDTLLGCNMQPGAGVAGAGRCAQACL